MISQLPLFFLLSFLAYQFNLQVRAQKKKSIPALASSSFTSVNHSGQEAFVAKLTLQKNSVRKCLRSFH